MKIGPGLHQIHSSKVARGLPQLVEGIIRREAAVERERDSRALGSSYFVPSEWRRRCSHKEGERKVYIEHSTEEWGGGGVRGGGIQTGPILELLSNSVSLKGGE